MLNMTEMFMCRICVCFDMYRPKHLMDVCNHMWQLIFASPDQKKKLSLTLNWHSCLPAICNVSALVYKEIN